MLLEIPTRFRHQRQHRRAMAAERRRCKAGESVSFAYRQFWCWTPPDQARPRDGDPLAHGQGRQAPALRRRVRLGRFRRPSEARSSATASLEANPGQHRRPSSLYPYHERRSIRVVFDLDPGSSAFSELRLVLKIRQQAGKRDLALPMDSVILESDAGDCKRRGDGATEAPLRPAMPREAPLAMPVQSLYRFPRRSRRPWTDPARAPTPWLSRLVRVRRRACADRLRRARNVRRRLGRRGDACSNGRWSCCSCINFSWIALAFTLERARFRLAVVPGAEVRAAAGRAQRAHRGRDADLQRGAGAGVLRAAGDRGGRRARPASANAFDFFFLSDTTNPDVWIAEERALLALRERPAEGALLLPPPQAQYGAARPATSPISSPAGAPPIRRCWCSTPTA